MSRPIATDATLAPRFGRRPRSPALTRALQPDMIGRVIALPMENQD